MTSAPDERYRAPALDKGLDILEILAEQPGGLTRAEIVKAMGRSPGEAYRMLERLVVRGYVVRSMEGDRYALSMKLFALAHRHTPLLRLTAPAQPLMDGFARVVGQSCHLVAPDGEAAMVIAQAHCPGNWEFGLRIGARIDLLSTGSGQVLLAFMAPEPLSRLQADWVELPSRQVWDRIQLDLGKYRRAGYRAEASQQVLGIQDVSVPILSQDGHALAVLTCPYVERLDQDANRFADVIAGMIEIAQNLSISQFR